MAASTKSANVVSVSDAITTATFDLDIETPNTVRYKERRKDRKNTIYLEKSKFANGEYPVAIVVTYRVLRENAKAA